MSNLHDALHRLVGPLTQKLLIAALQGKVDLHDKESMQKYLQAEADREAVRHQRYEEEVSKAMREDFGCGDHRFTAQQYATWHWQRFGARSVDQEVMNRLLQKREKIQLFMGWPTVDEMAQLGPIQRIENRQEAPRCQCNIWAGCACGVFAAEQAKKAK